MKYTKTFDLEATNTVVAKRLDAKKLAAGDRRDGLVYLYTPEIELTVNIALATKRPVLLRGPSGSGKSSLARNVALRMQRRYYEEVISSKTQHTDLEWHFDLLRRFRDAQANQLKADADYMEPRALWWAFDPASATRRGLAPPELPERPAEDPSDLPGEDAVVLIDEIDKADPDVPNNLLVALGSLEFSVSYLGDLRIKAARTPLVFITSNDERDLPAAFLRRCVVLELKPPKIDRMVDIAGQHFGNSAQKRKKYRDIADALYSVAGEKPIEPSTAEYLDAVRACVELDVQPDPEDPVWDCIVRTTVRKAGTPLDTAL